MSYSEEYRSKLVSAKAAVQRVKSGDYVHYGHFMMAPTEFDACLAERKDELRGVKVVSACFPGIPRVVTCDPLQEHFIYNDWHFGPGSRKLHDNNLCYYIPMLYHEVPRVFERYHEPDFFVTKAARMDGKGYFNFSISNSIHYVTAKKSKKVIIEVCESAPVCLGGSGECIHISEVDMIIEGDGGPVKEIAPVEPDEIDVAIAGRIVGLIEDESVIQLGIGAMPNAVGKMIAQSDLKDLGAHTEMLADSYVDMYDSGVLTGKAKAFDRGKMAFTFAMGTQKLYSFLDRNPACASYQVDYTNDPLIASRHKKLIAINNAIEVDLYGQVCSESYGIRQISGTGGQHDFIYAAFRSEGGKGFVCLSSLRTKGDRASSRIVPTLQPGAIVTVPRAMSHLIATEYGVVDLKGKSTWERAELLISIAHPDVREELVKSAEKMNIWARTSKL